ncbi:MAG: hypothetical protein JNL28_12675 [Planctomycetes bacterium]|nr:hypothetical protein [Planctomycetota bacterium]
MARRSPVSTPDLGAHGRTRIAFGSLLLALLCLVTAIAAAPATREAQQGTVAPNVSGCLACHAGIEDMHPEAGLTCVDCHGGDANAKRKNEAHVASLRTEPRDERVAPIDEDLAYRRFVNPMDLRVMKDTCGKCHADLVEHLRLSLHGTTAGHLSDGYYEMGVLGSRGSAFSVFPAANFRQVPAFRGKSGSEDLGTHFTDLARKECLQCHLYSEGRAVRGRVGFDGDYRGEGCAACHVEYGRDGLSQSRDRSAVRTEPGHPRQHKLMRSPTTDTCTSCHYGDAAIGTNFRGLGQLPPGAAGGPDIPGTTRELLNRQYYLSDPAVNPPDVHHERGMHCIDCHTLGDVMGDGAAHGSMEQQVEISCSDCHGTFTARSTLKTERGNRITNLRRDGDKVVLVSKVTGEEHPVVQVVDVLDPASRDYNPRAAQAMNSAHGNVECYTCHAAWNPNFLGFHFDRNESLSQLDLLTGRRTEGRVTTQEKVFSTWKSFYAGLNERGAVAPYLTGFSTMGSVSDAKGERILDQVLPVTAAGLSGMTMIHHQMHTTRSTARSCIECHRTSTTWGLGSSNFQLARQLAFVADRRGIEVVALNRSQIAASAPLAKIVLPDVTCLAIRSDPLQGHATELFAGEGARGIHVIDVTTPTAPKRLAFIDSVEPHGMQWSGDWLYVADGPGGLRIFDVSDPRAIKSAGRVATVDAQAVHVQWPYAYVADGEGGLVIVDVSAPIAPRVIGGALLAREDGAPGKFIGVQSLFQYSRPRARKDKDGIERVLNERIPARNVCAVLDETRGLILVDVTEPTLARQIYPDPKRKERTRPGRGDGEWRGMVLASHVDLAQPQGGTRTSERDYAYLLSERGTGNEISSVSVVDITDPTRPRLVGASIAGQATESLTLASFYNTPFLQTIAFACGEDGVFATDVSISTQPTQLGALAAMQESYVIAVESFPLDRMIDERSRRLKDVSHEGSRWLYASEIQKILSVPAAALGLTAATPLAAWPLGAAHAEFARLDADRSGWLTDKELSAAPSGVDADGDGRATFAEFARVTGALPVTPGVTGVREGPRFRASRVDPDGDLSRLLDLVDPIAFDKDGDSRLSRAEMEAALFAALDLDGNKFLSRAEASRNPGVLRRLRYGDPAAAKAFAALDIGGTGRLAPGEMRMRDEDWRALDSDGDGGIQVPVLRRSKAARSGKPIPRSEWPTRQPFRAPLAPDATIERLLAMFDKDGDRNLSRRELEKRPDFLVEMDDNDDDIVGYEELKVRCDVLLGRGVDVVHDGFVERWDLDGDGKVSPAEVPVAAWLRRRLGL